MGAFDDLIPGKLPVANAPAARTIGAFDDLIPKAPEPMPDELGIGEEVRGLGRGLVRGYHRTVQADMAGALQAIPRSNAELQTAQQELADFDVQFPKTTAANNPAGWRWRQNQLGRIATLQSEIATRESMAPGLAQSFAEHAAAAQSLPMTGAQKEFFKPETPWWKFFENPVELSTITTAESLPTMGKGLVGAPLGPVGVALGMGSSSLQAESAARVQEKMAAANVDLENPEAVLAYFRDTAAANRDAAKAELAALGPAGFDALTGGIAGRWLRGALGQGFRKVGVATGKEIGVQMAGGGVGSIAGAGLAGEAVDWKDVVLEIAGEIAPGEAVSNVASERGRQRRQANAPTTAPAAGAFEDLVPKTAGEQDAASPIRLGPVDQNLDAVAEVETEIGRNVVPPNAQRVDDATGKPVAAGGSNQKPVISPSPSVPQTSQTVPPKAKSVSPKPLKEYTTEQALKDLPGVVQELRAALLGNQVSNQKPVISPEPSESQPAAGPKAEFTTPAAGATPTAGVASQTPEQRGKGAEEQGGAKVNDLTAEERAELDALRAKDRVELVEGQEEQRMRDLSRKETQATRAKKTNSEVALLRKEGVNVPESFLNPEAGAENHITDWTRNGEFLQIRVETHKGGTVGTRLITVKAGDTLNNGMNDTSPGTTRYQESNPNGAQPANKPKPTRFSDLIPEAKETDWEAYGEELRGNLDSFSPARDTGQTDYDLMDVGQRFIEFARKDTSGKTRAQLVGEFAQVDEAATPAQLRKLRAAVKDIEGKPNAQQTQTGVAVGGGGAVAGQAPVPAAAATTPAKAKKKKDLMNQPPPGGWTDADKVPEQYRKPVQPADGIPAPEISVYSHPDRVDQQLGYKFKATATSNEGGFLAVDGKGKTEQEARDHAVREFNRVWAKRKEERTPKGRMYPSYTTEQLKAAVADQTTDADSRAKMAAEIAKRESGESVVKRTPQIVPPKAAKPEQTATELLTTLRNKLREQEATGVVDDRLLKQVQDLEKAVRADTDAKLAEIRAKREEIKARLRKKLGQTNVGVDPEVATIAAELAVNYTQEGIVRFKDFARAVHEELPDIWEALKGYLRGAWTTAADLNDGIEEVSRDEARAILEGIDKPAGPEQSKPQATDDTQPGISPKSPRGTGATQQPGNESAGPAGAGNRGDVADSVPPAGASAPSGGRAGRGGKRAGSSGVAAGTPAAGGLSGSAATGGAGTNPVRPDDGSSVPQPDHVVRRENYWLKNPEAIVGGGPKARFAKNQRAIETLQRLITEQKDPTNAEQDILAAYTGWGAFGQELFNGSWDAPDPKKGWESEDAWLRDHMGEADWKSAQTSIINAHYTDPVTVGMIWRALERMGFRGGRVLEPAMGIGNFFSIMPREVMRNSVLTGIEMDQLTGRIAQMLHPQAGISIKPYQDSKTADDFYDLVLGNWPFSDNKPADRRYNHFSPVLHDYFFLKALDQVRPGGLVVGITSTGTMDKASPTVRRYLAARGELIAAFRLPAGTFGEYAGTKVVTDLIFLRKRAAKVENPTDAWIDTVDVETKAGKFRVNKYYQQNPGQVIGTLGFGHGTTKGRPGMMVTAPANHQAVIEALPSRLPENVFQPWKRPDSKVKHIQGVPANARQFAIIEKDGDLYQVQGEQLALLQDLRKWKLKHAKDTARRMAEARAAIGVRDRYDAMMDAYRKGEDFDAARKALAVAYHEFRKKHGSVRQSTMVEVMERAGDSGMISVLNLEDEQGQPRAILERNILRKKIPNGAGSIEDAYAIQRNKSARFSVEEVAKVSGRAEAEVIARLVELNQIFQVPDGTWQARDEYLADNVRRKLREAEAALEAGMDMGRNIEALKTVMPKDTPYFEIEVRMGANWVSHGDYKNYVAHLIKTTPEQVEVQRQATGWRVKIDDHTALHSPEATTLWGINHRGTPFSTLFNAAMNGTTVVVKVQDENKNMVPDRALTEQANGKVDAIREEFQKWIWQDSERIARLSNEYNEANNSMVAPDRDGSHLMLEGLALTLGDSEFDFRKHQKDAVWRGVQDGKGMFGHEVGTGKTFTMAGLAMEGRRLGAFRKPLIFAHNANHATVIADFRKAYPAGKFLHLDSLSPDERAAKLRQIVLDDWDAVVVPHSLIERFTLREETLNELAAKEIQALEDETFAEIVDAGHEIPSREILDDAEAFNQWASFKEGLVTAKNLVKSRLRIKERIHKKAQEASKEGAVFFEDLGVDAIFVDEAHIFKKIALATRKKIKGLNTAESGIGFSLSLLTDYVKSRNAGKGTFLFTGTPITNTLNEAYNMMKYVMSTDMTEAGIERFDDWFNVFADSETQVEMNDAGIYEPIDRLRAFINVPELARMAGRYFDIVLAKDMPEFKPRASDEGMTERPIGRPRKKIIPTILEMSPAQVAHREDIRRRYQNWMNADGKARRKIMQEGKDSPLQISTEASLAALDFRLIDRTAADFAGSKASVAVNNIAGIYHEHAQTTQMVFMEQGFNDYTDRDKKQKDDKGRVITNADGKPLTVRERVAKYNVLRDMVTKLNEKGIPPEEIAIFANMKLDPLAVRPNDILRRCVRVTGAVSKEDISRMMRSGKVRVAFGQTETMGTGVNAQDYLRAMHHLDAPWMPGSLEQRNGRGWRQGNKWNTVLEYRYTVEGSGDGKRWQVLLNKVRFIARFIELLNGEGTGERTFEGDAANAEEGDDSVSSFEATFSAAAGDPRQMLRVMLEKKLRTLETKQSNHLSATWQAGRKIDDLNQQIERAEKNIGNLTQDLTAYRNEIAGQPFEFEVEGTRYTDRDLAESAVKALPLSAAPVMVGGRGSFKMWTYGAHSQNMAGPSGMTYDMGTRSIASAEAVLRNIGSRLEKLQSEIPKMRASIEGLQQMANTPFSGAAKLAAAKQSLQQIEMEIQASPFPVPSWIRTTAPQGSLFYLKQAGGELVAHDVAAHRWDANGWWILYEDGNSQLRPVDYATVLDEQGQPIFDPRPFVAPPTAAKGPTLASVVTQKPEPDESQMDYGAGGEMPRATTFMDWLDQAIEATDYDPTRANEGVTGAPVWLVRGVANGALRLVRASLKGGMQVADAISEALRWIKAQNPSGYNEAEARTWLETAAKQQPDEDTATLKIRVEAAERELQNAISQHMSPPAGMTKKQAKEIKNLAAAKLRNLRHDLLHSKEYVEEMVMAERAVHRQIKALLDGTGIPITPDALVERDEKIQAALSEAQRRRLVELFMEWERVREEIAVMPKKLVGAVVAQLYPKAKAGAPTDINVPSEWLQAQLGTRSPVAEPQDIETAGDRFKEAVRGLPGEAKAVFEEGKRFAAQMHAKARTAGNRDVVAATKDAADNKAQILSRQAANVVLHELNRAFGVALDTRNVLRERALTFAVEAGNLEALQEMRRTIEESDAARKKWGKDAVHALNYAEQHWARFEDIIPLYERISTAQVTAENASGIKTLTRSGGYVFHLQDVLENWAHLDVTGGAGGLASPFKNIRDYATYADSIAAGLNPKSLNAIDLMQRRISLGQKLINYRAWVEQLKGLNDPATGLPLATDVVVRVRADGSETETAPIGYQLQKFAGQTYAVHRGYVGLFKALTTDSNLRQTAGWHFLMKSATTAKHFMLLFDTFHLGRLAYWSSITRGAGQGAASLLPGNPFSHKRGLTLLDATPADIRKMGQAGELPAGMAEELLKQKGTLAKLLDAGLNVGSVGDNIYADWVQKLPVAGHFNRWLFEKYQRGAMTEVALIEFERQRRLDPTAAEAEVARKTARAVNIRFGNLNSQAWLKSRFAQDLFRVIFLAPQWNESLLRSEIGAVRDAGGFLAGLAQGKLRVGTLGRAVVTAFIGQFIANQLINYFFRGQPTWDNDEEGFEAKLSAWVPDVVGNSSGYFLNPLTLPAEMTHLILKGHARTGRWDEALMAAITSRFSAFGRFGVTFYQGKNSMGERATGLGSRLGLAVEESAPLPIGAQAPSRMIASAVTGENKERYPGMFQRQLMQSVGIKPDTAPSAERRITALAQAFNRKSGVPDLERMHSPYSDLDNYLRVGNYTAAKAALREVLETRTVEQVRQRYKARTAGRFTGSSTREDQFKAGLTAEQRARYAEAMGDRQRIKYEVEQLLKELGASGAAGKPARARR
jgi:N12 class adenine-specific DNA methylase